MINGRTLWLTSDWNTAFTSEFLDSPQWPGEAMFDPYQTTFDEEVPQDEWFMQKATWENVDNLTPDKFNELFLEVQHFYSRYLWIFLTSLSQESSGCPFPISFVFAKKDSRAHHGMAHSVCSVCAWLVWISMISMIFWYSKLPEFQKVPELLMLWQA